MGKDARILVWSTVDMQVWGFGFGVWGFGFWVLGFVFRSRVTLTLQTLVEISGHHSTAVELLQVCEPNITTGFALYFLVTTTLHTDSCIVR